MALGRRILGYGGDGARLRADRGRLRAGGAGLWEGLKSLFGYGAAGLAQARRLRLRTCSGPISSAASCPGLVAAIASYWLTRPLIAAYQVARRERARRPRAARARWRGELRLTPTR